MRRIIAAAVLAGMGLLGLTAPALAQAAWPTKPVKIIIPFAAGGGADISVRHLQPILSEILGQPVIVDIKSGGGGIVGTEQMVRAAPDGHTFGMVVSALASHPALNKTMPYDALKDVTPITVLFRATNVWVAHPSAPWKSMADVVAAAKAANGKFPVVTSGAGTAQHLGLEQLRLMAGFEVSHVFYRGAGPALSDLASGQVQIGILNISSTLPFIKDGRLRGLAVTSGKRSAFAPDLPSVGETVAGFASDEWFAFIGPAGIPPDVLAKLHAAIVKAAGTATYKEKAKEMGVELVVNSPEEFKKLLAEDVAKFADLVKRANIKLD